MYNPLTKPSSWYLMGLLSCIALLAAAYYFEYILYMDPCPLCMVQRLVTALIGVGFLIALIGTHIGTHIDTKARFLTVMGLLLTAVTGGFGVWVADHHVWLQGLPPEEVPACGPDLAYMIETLPLKTLITTVLEGSGSCADISWSFLGMSMPEWTRLWFAGFAVLALALIFRKSSS